MSEWDKLPSTPADATDVEFLESKLQAALARIKALEDGIRKHRKLAIGYFTDAEEERDDDLYRLID